MHIKQSHAPCDTTAEKTLFHAYPAIGKRLACAMASLFILTLTSKAIAETPQSNPAQALTSIHLIKGGTQSPTKGAAEYFTGDVEVDLLFPAGDPLHISGGYVTFKAGARTAWHTHPQGQMLIITAGAGRVQQWGGQILEVKPGDVVWFPPHVKHWHGAMPDMSMTHIALAEIADGVSVTWMEKVTGE